MRRPLCLILNPQAGGGRARALLPQAIAVLAEAGAEHRLIESASLEHAKDLAAEAAGRGEVVVAFGGDGMAGALAGVASAGGASYGLIPAGRGNDFASALGIPADAAGAAKILAAGQVRTVDLIGVGVPGRPEHVVAGSVYAGLPALAGQVANATRLIGGSLVYPVAALRVLARWHPAYNYGVVERERDLPLPERIPAFTLVLQWRPNVAGAVFIGVLAALACLSLRHVSEFLYFKY